MLRRIGGHPGENVGRATLTRKILVGGVCLEEIRKLSEQAFHG